MIAGIAFFVPINRFVCHLFFSGWLKIRQEVGLEHREHSVKCRIPKSTWVSLYTERSRVYGKDCVVKPRVTVQIILFRTMVCISPNTVPVNQPLTKKMGRTDTPETPRRRKAEGHNPPPARTVVTRFAVYCFLLAKSFL
jgi:hypothetical protein